MRGRNRAGDNPVTVTNIGKLERFGTLRRRLGGDIGNARLDRAQYWRSQGKGENPAKSMGLPVFPTRNRTLFHKENFDLWQTKANNWRELNRAS